MQSVHACACFVRIGRCCLGSILESFWEPSSPLYSFWVARVAKKGHKREGKTKKSEILGAGRGGSNTLRWTWSPPLRLVTFGVEAEGFATEGLHFQDFRNTCSAERTDFQSVLS